MSPDECELLPATDPRDPLLAPLQPPGCGATVERFHVLWNAGRRAPALGRIIEAHHDALAILAEAGRAVAGDELFGVWAAGGPNPLRLERAGSRSWHLRGDKHWCSAATFARRALVTATSEAAGGVLALVDLSSSGVHVGESSWQSPAMAAVGTRTVHFDVLIDDDDVIGVDDWYLRRPGFWHGAVGVAACWAGCIDGVVDRLGPMWRDDAHALAHLGAVDSLRWTMRVAIDAAAGEIDADPVGSSETRRRRALRVRHTVDATITDVIDRIGRALGPGPMAHVPSLHRHLAEIDLYRRQSHAERDLEELGRLASVAADACNASPTGTPAR